MDFPKNFRSYACSFGAYLLIGLASPSDSFANPSLDMSFRGPEITDENPRNKEFRGYDELTRYLEVDYSREGLVAGSINSFGDGLKWIKDKADLGLSYEGKIGDSDARVGLRGGLKKVKLEVKVDW